MFRKSDGFEGIIGTSLRMQKLFRIIDQVADDGDSTVLIQGESGTGKELVARAIHSRSPRSQKNFVPVNCAAIPDDLLESELFGYVKGAFTGATQNKMGRIQYAAGGTLFLDEIGDMKPSLQAKLLRVLQEKEYEPVGGVKPVPVDVRIVAATHRDLEKLVAEGKFREDLYYRLSVIPMQIPALRDRRDDIPVLLESFCRVFNRGKRNPLQGFSEEAMRALATYPWPGNVRELENLVQRLVVLHGGETVGLEDLPAKYTAHIAAQGQEVRTDSTAPAASATPLALHDAIWNGEGIDFNDLVDGLERQLISQALARTGGNKKEAARLLNLKRTTLIEKIKKKQIDIGLGIQQASCA
ncbi:MAG: sigma-54 dependent transcriptional regulator [Geothermobacteraceae bacterium]